MYRGGRSGSQLPEAGTLILLRDTSLWTCPFVQMLVHAGLGESTCFMIPWEVRQRSVRAARASL